ncbi:hypothetical protein D1007_53506 [Hordeum vulgare]|nr:hypothetical protein D1007_53506 [Hordeum vulgare]
MPILIRGAEAPCAKCLLNLGDDAQHGIVHRIAGELLGLDRSWRLLVFLVEEGHKFFTDLKVLALSTYDVIVGTDSLEEHNPMIVDWRDHFIEISTPAGPLRLIGHDATSIVCESINNS